MRLAHEEEFRLAELARIEARLRTVDRRRLKAAFIGAVLLHASLGLGIASWTPPEPVSPPGEMMITIDLASAAMEAPEETAAVGDSAQSAPQEETPPPEPEPEPVEEVVEEPPPEPEPIEEPLEEPAPEPVIEEKIEPPPPAEKAAVVVAPAKEVQPKAKPKPKPKTAAARAASAQNRPQADVAGSGARADPSALAAYIGRLRAALERRKRYPSAAGGAGGTASLRFTVNRAGQVTGFTITRSSGNAALDAATRAMVQGASLPPIPEGLPGSITVGVPVNFRVR